MITVRRSHERGHFNHGWLDTFHTFSFGDYFDPAHVQFRDLRVMNEDRVAPGQGFGMHGHRDMEIVTYVLSGALEHRDSLGNGEVLRPGELQRMTAGTGIRHSEFNPSETEPVHLYQIWILPEQRGLTPSYEQKKIADLGRPGAWRLVASPDAAEGSLRIHQKARLYLATLEPSQTLTREVIKQSTVRANSIGTDIGYARVSSTSQDLEIQKAKLKAAGCEIVRAETGSGASRDGRTELATVLEFLRAGDELVVHRLDRLGRSTRDVLNLVHELDAKGASLRILEPEVTTAGDMGRMVITVLGMVADMELKFIRDRQRAGINAAKGKGIYKGRQKKVDDAEIQRLAAAGTSKAQIARDLGVSRMTVYRALDTGSAKADADPD